MPSKSSKEKHSFLSIKVKGKEQKSMYESAWRWFFASFLHDLTLTCRVGFLLFPQDLTG
jgi:hypothetical protein